MSTRTFWCVQPDEQRIVLELQSKTPREAALKAASRDQTRIFLADVTTGKLHIFSGEKRPLTDTQKNTFTALQNIQTRPYASKLAYRNLNQSLHRSDLSRISQEFMEMMA